MRNFSLGVDQVRLDEIVAVIHVDRSERWDPSVPTNRGKGKVVEQFVRKDHPRHTAPNVVGGERIDGQHSIRVVLTLGFRSLDSDVAEVVSHTRRRCVNRSCQSARAGSKVDEREFFGLAESVPFGIYRTRYDVSEQRPHFSARQEVPSPTRPTSRGVEPELGVVERSFDNGGVGHRPVNSNVLADQLVERCEQSAQPPTPSSVTLETVSTIRGHTPKARVAKAVRPTAPRSDGGIRKGVISPSGASSAHIVRSTAR